MRVALPIMALVLLAALSAPAAAASQAHAVCVKEGLVLGAVMTQAGQGAEQWAEQCNQSVEACQGGCAAQDGEGIVGSSLCPACPCWNSTSGCDVKKCGVTVDRGDPPAWESGIWSVKKSSWSDYHNYHYFQSYIFFYACCNKLSETAKSDCQ